MRYGWAPWFLSGETGSLCWIRWIRNGSEGSYYDWRSRDYD